MVKKILTTVAFLLVTLLAITFINAPSSSAKNIFKIQSHFSNKNLKTSDEKLALIDNYQKKYFEIVKRNDVLLNIEENDAVKKDNKELKKLYSQVKKQIKNKEFLNKYKDIEKRFSICEEETTIGMNKFAANNYTAVDNLLNEVYKEVQSKISPEDFKKLAQSENEWLNEVEAYEKVFNSKGFGTIGTIVYYGYEIDMRSFRTLLLMLYL